MNCPKCGDTPLTAVSMPVEDRSVPGPAPSPVSLEVDQCPTCSGVWFDPAELDKYLSAKVKLSVPKATAASDAELDAKAASCPRCAVALSRRPAPYNPKLGVDVCGKCGGTWIDAAELGHAGGEKLPFADRMKALFGDIKPRR